MRPNPNLTLTLDQIDPFPGGLRTAPSAYLLPLATVNYLHERQHKRELRRESAQEATTIAVSGQADLERTLLFDLRTAFVQNAAGQRPFSIWRRKISRITTTCWK